MEPMDVVPTVQHDIHMQVVIADGNRVALPATLTYRAEDPFAVTATFRTADNEISWVFARELLRDGLRDIAGHGDIVVRPGHPSRGARVSLTLSSPSGSAVIEGSREQIGDFVAEMYRAVPEDTEWMYLDLDRTIEDLLEAS